MTKTSTALCAQRTDVLIVGAGPTGLALACDLSSRGIAVRIIDKALGPATTSRALVVHARGAEILDRLGALGDLPQRAVKALAFNFYLGQQMLARMAVPAVAGTPLPLVIGQTEVEAQLRPRLAELQSEVIWGCELLGAEEDTHDIKVTLRTADGDHEMRTGWLVGCDGAHSKTRKLAGIGFEGTAFAERFLLADVRLDWSRPRAEFVAHFHADGMFAAMPLPGGDTWRLMVELQDNVAVGPDGHGGSISKATGVALLQKLLRERVGDTTTRVSDPIWVSLFRFHQRLASTYRRGRILLAGDAAHIHSPFGGQGMNTGLGDAFNLGWKLALVIQGRATDRLLDSYEAERRPVATDVLASTKATTNIFLGNSIWSRLIRDHVMFSAGAASRGSAPADGQELAVQRQLSGRPARGRRRNADAVGRPDAIKAAGRRSRPRRTLSRGVRSRDHIGRADPRGLGSPSVRREREPVRLCRGSAFAAGRRRWDHSRRAAR